MRLLEINVCCGRLSTGTIVSNISKTLIDNGHEVCVAYGGSYKDSGIPVYKIGGRNNQKMHALQARFFDNAGFNSSNETKKLLLYIDAYKPDIIHLHNLHGYYLDISLLFQYIKEKQIKTVWTMHDCWAFTGHCTYFDRIGCNKWKNGCYKCAQKKEYPKSILFDRSKCNYNRKRQLLCNGLNMIIVSPSKWLAEKMRESFLGHYPIQVVNNGIDVSIFNRKDSVKKYFEGTEKNILLGVASPWSRRKGLNDFVELAKILPDKYRIVLVGVSEQQKKILSYNNIIGISHTDRPEELAQIYRESEVFLNLTYEDNYPTVNLEALSCGTPIISYNTGGSVETVDESCIVEKGDIKRVRDIIISNSYRSRNDLDPSNQRMCNEYLELFQRFMKKD